MYVSRFWLLKNTADARLLASFRELGPPDLCHVVKSTGKAGQRDVC